MARQQSPSRRDGRPASCGPASRGPHRRPAAALARPALVALTAILLAGCGTGSSSTASHAGSSGGKLTVLAKSLHVGTVLVSAKGFALYVFAPDDQRQVTCTSLCAATWPPLKLPPGGTLAAGPGLKSALLGSDPDPAGGRVVTYNGWPLYLYTGDVYAGQYTGQGIDLNGGDWYVMRPTGQPLKTALP